MIKEVNTIFFSRQLDGNSLMKVYRTAAVPQGNYLWYFAEQHHNLILINILMKILTEMLLFSREIKILKYVRQPDLNFS